jgi:AcrR family transcriptional regulator
VRIIGSSDQRRSAIITAAIAVLTSDGIAATTTRKIAKTAGVNQAMLGYYFGSKDELLFAVLEELMQQTRAIAQELWTNQHDLRTLIAESITAFWATVERQPEVQTMQLELTLYALRQPSSAWLAKQQYAGYGGVIAQLFQDGCATTGQTCAVPFDVLARFVMGGLDGLILQFISDRDVARARIDLAYFIAAVIALAEGTTPATAQESR